MANRKINELSPRTPSLTDLIIVGDPSTGYSFKATISVLAAFAGSNIQFSSLGGISLTSPSNGQYLTFNGTNWVNSTLSTTTWDTAYNRSLTAAAVTGTTTKTLTLTKQDGSTLTASWSDLNTDAVTSVFGRTGVVVAAEGDYTLDQLGGVTITTPSTNQVLQYNGTDWVNATFVAGINSLNGLTATTQTFATGTSGTDFAISSTTSTHTFNLPTASGTNRGALSSADWTTFNGKVGGSGTTNYLPKWTGSTALGNSIVSESGNTIGIDAVGGNALLIIRSPSGQFYPTLRFTGNANLSADIYSYDRRLYTSALNGHYFTNGTTTQMLLTASGRLLIGTTTESTFLLDVNGKFRAQSFNLDLSGSIQYVNFASANALFNTGSSFTFSFFNGSGSFTIASDRVSTSRRFDWLNSATDPVAGTSGTYYNTTDNALRIYNGTNWQNILAPNSSGNVGIGTTSPAAILETYRSTDITGRTNTFTQNIFSPTSGFTGYFKVNVGARSTRGVQLIFGESGNSRPEASITYDVVDFDIVGGSGNIKISTTTNERMRIFGSTGNVFIGSSPTDAGYKLDVNGTARVKGSSLVVGDGSTTNQEFLDILGATNAAIRYYKGATHTFTTGTGNWSVGNQDFAIQNIQTSTVAFFIGGNNSHIGIGTTSPNASALLDITSTTKGFLPPRMTGAQAEAIATPAAGLMVYANNGNGTTITSLGWWGYDGTNWVKLN